MLPLGTKSRILPAGRVRVLFFILGPPASCRPLCCPEGTPLRPEGTAGLEAPGSWRQPSGPGLAVPLPLAALFDPVLTEEAIARALAAKDNPVILEIKDMSEKRGRVAALLTVLSTRGFVLSEGVHERIRAADPETLELWLRRAVSASSLDEVTGEG